MAKKRLNIELGSSSYHMTREMMKRLETPSMTATIQKALATLEIVTLHGNEFWVKLPDGELEKVRVI